MISAAINREERLIRVDRQEADDLLVLLRLVGTTCGNPAPGSQSGEVNIPLSATAGDAELDRAEAIVAEFNRMRSSRATHHAQDN